MYKNFNLTESEKEQILNLHKEKGYKKSMNEQYGDAGNYEMNALSSERYQDEYQDYMDELSPEQQESFKQLQKYETHLIHIANKMRENSMGKYRKPNNFMDLLINNIPFYNDDININ